MLENVHTAETEMPKEGRKVWGTHMSISCAPESKHSSQHWAQVLQLGVLGMQLRDPMNER